MNLLALALLAAVATPDSEQVMVRRFVFVAAAKDGGDERAQLRYAVSDAHALAGVLEELGGVAVEDRVIVIDPTRKELSASFERLEERLITARADSSRVELIVYYSGHSDERGLLLGEERFDYDELRAQLDRMSADVRIAILDSCASGAITRKKGGKRRPPFLVDKSTQARGYAVLTSSSENEAAQESDRIGASFFTHYLVSGLRGAADLSNDGRVTLNEAYHFAFHETLARTEKTLGGPQHPAYDIQLVGSGDLVMTDINATTAVLGLPEALSARVFVRDTSGRLVAELEKPSGRRVDLGLAPGRYDVTLQRKKEFLQGTMILQEGSRVDLDTNTLDVVEGEVTVLRGGGPEYVLVPVDFGIWPQLSLNGREEHVTNYVSFSLLWGHTDRLRGVGLGAGATSAARGVMGVQIASGLSYAGGEGMYGTQIAAGAAITTGAMIGAQLSAGVNVAGPGMIGLQATAGVNVAGEDAIGSQWTAGINVAEALTGAQLAASVNVAGDLTGAQVAPGNYADRLSGAQIGIINIAGESDGLQLGLINVSAVNRGEAIGLLSYSLENGILRPIAFTSDVGLFGAGLKLGTGHVYTMGEVATGTFHHGGAFRTGLALGVTFDVDETFRIDVNSGTAVTYRTRKLLGETTLVSTTRATVAWRVTPAFAVFAGPSFNILTNLGDDDTNDDLTPGYAWKLGDENAAWIGWTLGVEFFD